MFEPLHETAGWTLGRWRCGEGIPHGAVEERAVRHEVVIPLRGVFERERRDRRTMASPVTAVLADRGDTYAVRHPMAEGDECLVVLLDDRTLEDLGRATGAVGGCSVPRFLRHEARVPAPVFLAAVGLLRTARSGRAFPTENACAELLSLLLPSSDPAASRPCSGVEARHRAASARAAAFMAANYRSPLSLAEIASEAAYSPFHFARVFRSVTGVSPYRYVMELRLRSAVHQLRGGREDLSRLALGLGFSSHSHMSAAFRDTFGRTPSEIRAGFR